MIEYNFKLSFSTLGLHELEIENTAGFLMVIREKLNIYLDSIECATEGLDNNMISQNLVSLFQERFNRVRHSYTVEDGRQVLTIGFSHISGVGCPSYKALFEKTDRVIKDVYYILDETGIDSLEGEIELIIGQ